MTNASVFKQVTEKWDIGTFLLTICFNLLVNAWSLNPFAFTLKFDT